ncbi:beta-RFAP synthase [Methanolinea mesophila]|uniref:GHMP family kinase ATP-binding protein n=1 Tax=Methanolinea mesophila TaxID=547055 RepID=UPI001AEB168D|nr:GHMP kinase [Methanolinea mesophila]MBP1927668.1 beta-RFAP synthase [Methanolinea mesophila]
MPVMMIRGGDLDLVEYEFSSFSPGEHINTLGLDRAYSLKTIDGTVTVRAPARIHLTVMDMNRFAPNRPGGGGVGFAIQLYCSVEVRCTPGGVEIDYNRAPIIRHFVEVFRKVTGYSGGFAIVARDHEHPHVGLGSTSTIMIALAKALNFAVGSPLSDEQLRKLVGNNYVEETAEGTIASGFETGVGPAASIHGGMAIMGDELTLIYHHPFARGKNVYIVIPPSDISSAGTREFDLLMNKARLLDYRDRELKAYLVLMDLIPALERDDLAAMGVVIGEIDFRGSKRAEVEHHSFRIYQYMSAMRDAGLEFVGMSSVGPSIAIITEKDRDEVARIVEPLGLRIGIATQIDNEGLSLTHHC